MCGQYQGVCPPGAPEMPLFQNSVAGRSSKLSAMEFKMLNLFCKNPKQVLTRQQLWEKLWDVDEKYVDEHTLTTVSYTHL